MINGGNYSITHTKLWFSLPRPSTMNGIPFIYYWSAPSFIPLSHYSNSLFSFTCLPPMNSLHLLLHWRNKCFSCKRPQPSTQSTKLHSLLLKLPAFPPFSCWLLQDLVLSSSSFCDRTNLSPPTGFSLVHKHTQISQNIFKKLSLDPESSL